MCFCSNHSHNHDSKAGTKITRDDLANVSFLDDENWAQFVESDKVSLLFFMLGAYHECRRCIPDIVEFAKKYGNRFNIGVVDVAKSPTAVECCNINYLPTTIIARRGMFIEMRRGAVNADNEKQFLESLATIQGRDMDRLEARLA